MIEWHQSAWQYMNHLKGLNTMKPDTETKPTPTPPKRRGNNMQKIIIGVLVGLVLTTGFVAYKAGAKSGYSQGWSDAHCGKDLPCESGEE